MFILLTKGGTPLWMAHTEGRIGNSGCGSFSPIVGRGQHSGSDVPDQSAPAAKACAAVGMAFS